MFCGALGHSHCATHSKEELVMADTKTEPAIAVTRDNNGNLSCVLVDPFEVGDCQMNGGARVDMPVPTDQGACVVIWDADVFSRHPQAIFNDQWHQTFNFKTRRGTSIVRIGFDGPTLDNANQVKHVHLAKAILLDPDIHAAITQVDWTGEC
jgi:hypothetical protein